MPGVDNDDRGMINRLRLLVARTAQSDSLGWWEDESLTPGADLLLNRLFPRSRLAAAQRLAILGAKARHSAILQDSPNAKHLFFLGDAVEFQLDQSLSEEAPLDIPRESINSRDQLANLLRALGPEPQAFPIELTDHGRFAEVDMPIASMTIMEIALALAWAYTHIESARSALPYAIAEPAA